MMKKLMTTVAACACAFGLFADVIYVAPGGTGAGTTCIEYLTADDPVISPKVCRKRGNYPFKGMLGLAQESPFVKSGTPVYEKSGTFYINEPGVGTKNPWRPCTNKAASSATLDGATLVADGFGAARSADAFSYGPVVNRLPGLAVMLK